MVHHRENVLFLSPNTRVYQQSREVCNVYYHPWKTSHFKNFIPSEHIKIDHVVLSKFVDCQHAHIDDLTPSSQRPSPCTVQTPPRTHLGPSCTQGTYSRPSWMQGTYSRPSCTQGTWPTVHFIASSHTCSPMPPLASDVGHPDVGSLFSLCFVQGNISRCNGSKGRIARGQVLPLPDDLVVHRRENVLFLNPNTRVYQQSWEVCNVYYHPRKTSHFKNFIPSEHIKVDHVVLSKFVECHHAHNVV